MEPWFIATEKFGLADGESWEKFVAWSGLTQLKEVVSLDSSLCPTVLPDIKNDYWPHIVKQNFLLNFFIDLDFLIAQLSNSAQKNLLCVFRNPPKQPDMPKHLQQFVFLGYDLVELETNTSALTNCGGFPDVFSNSELSSVGLLSTHSRAVEIQGMLRELHPTEPHANCDLWAIYRTD
jgi:hypothetical protein